MYYVQATYEVKGSKTLVEGPRHNLPGIRKVFKKAMRRGTSVLLAFRMSNGEVSRERLVSLSNRLGLAINAERADLAAYNAEGPLEWKLAKQANDNLTNLVECDKVIVEAFGPCMIIEPNRTKRLHSMKLALA